MPVRHRMKLTPESFERVKKGEKKFEYRLNDEKRRALKVGERIEFAKLPELSEDCIVEITSLNIYQDFSDLYLHAPEGSIPYSRSEFLERMHEHYTPEEEQKYGVVSIGLK
jgi:ASC-1-like (ASCH) protein